METTGGPVPELSTVTENIENSNAVQLSIDKVPELPVETEVVRKNSIPSTDFKTVRASSEVNLENVPAKSGSLSHRGSVELHADIKNENNIKRVDSYSKFGVMETIPLEMPVPDATSNATEAVEKTENLSLQIRSISMNDNLLSERDPVVSLQMPHSATENDGNMLSKYFSSNVSKNVNAEGVEFFNALAENTIGANTNESVAAMGMKNLTETIQSTPADNSVADETKTEGQPAVLLKFFAEEKSGKDKDGKLFFDKIAEVKSIGNQELIKEDISSVNAAQTPFLSSPVLNGEIEEAWIPSAKTRQALVSVLTTASYVPDKSQLTFPEIIIEEELDDPVKTLLMECNSPQAQLRKVLTVNDVTEDEEGLHKLIKAECYHAAINLTKKLLKSCAQGQGDDGMSSKNTPLSLRLWYTRLALFVKLKKFSLAEVESAAFGDLDRPDLYYEFYPGLYNGKKGSMVPFSFRLLLAELPLHQGNYQIAMDNMYHVLNVIQRILSNVQNGCAEDGTMIELSESRKKASLDIWSQREQRVLYAILNCVLTQKDYILAVSIIKILIQKCENNISHLHSALGRIYLQLGDVKYAQDCFTKAAAVSQDPKFQVEENIDKALLAIALNNSEEAYNYYQQAYTLCPNDAMLANNMAVCLLYMGKLKESLALLEKTIHSNPLSCLHEGILFNTCTLYELESSRCTQKKIAMLELVSKYAGDAFSVSCLKIQLLPKA